MTTFGVVSDIHQDCQSNHYLHWAEEGIDVMVVAGDLQEGNGVESLVPYVEAGQRVIYVAGNHEYYSHEIVSTRQKIRDHAALAGVDFLDEDTVTINNVRIIGATLWTDFKLYGEGEEWFVRKACQHGMNDFVCIRTMQGDAMYKHGMNFTPHDALLIHKRNLNYISTIIRNPHDGPTVVVTHHAPSMMSVPAYYKEDRVSGGYASNLEDFILNYEPDIWIHGHTHSFHDYMIGKTRVICNPRGYHFEKPPKYAPLRFTL